MSNIPKLTKQRNCSKCGIILTEQNWPINARKYKGKIWYVCQYCYNIINANSVYKARKHIVLNKRPLSDHCEMCGAIKYRLSWHHWDDKDTSKGLWLCMGCHTVAETEEKRKELTLKYITLKQILEKPLQMEMF